ncbi:MAG TPA: gliding motility-associated C-terminal domain-containing protein, partial [Chitinophagales bacterium]|nr:gliding motility-associated C-terminal domain-containing protein [Chitinophagales bacterium]
MKMPVFILILILYSLTTVAQTCTNSRGEAIINYTFGHGPNPGPALAPGVTNLQYTSTDCPSDGSYTITNFTDDCFNAGWVTIDDHTGDPNGYFMLVNASIQPNTFYVDTITNLCGDVTYEFGAWIINVVDASGNYIEPDLTFTIRSPNGTVLQSNSTGNIAGSGTQWNYYSFNFTAGTGTSSAIFSISNNAPGGSGNDLAIDDISLRAIGPGIDVGIQGYTTDTVSFCGTIPPLTLTAQVESCYPVTVYQWQFSSDNGTTWGDIAGATNVIYSPTASAPGSYLYRIVVANQGNISNAQCRVISSVIAVYCTPGSPITVSPSDTTVCPGSTVVFTASGGTSYQWSDLTQGAQKTVTVTGPAFYIVSATNTGPGCTAVDTAFVHVYTIAVPVIAQQTIGSCGQDTAILSASGGAAYLWSNGSTSSAISIHPVTNATYTVTSTDANGCTATAAVTTVASTTWSINPDVVNPPCPYINTGAINLVASGNTSQLQYIWATGQTTNQLDSLAPGTYSVSVSDNGGCQTSFTFTLTYSYTLQVSISPQNINVPVGSSVTLQSTVNVNNGIQYTWSPPHDLSCTACAAPVVNVQNNAYKYTLTVTDQYGCQASDSARISAFQIPYVYIPNAFSPNGDGSNDFFQIFGPGSVRDYINHFSIKIFNRWGELVYESLDPGFKWNGVYKGTLLPPAV